MHTRGREGTPLLHASAVYSKEVTGHNIAPDRPENYTLLSLSLHTMGGLLGFPALMLTDLRKRGNALNFGFDINKA